jgi:hypothetical protein
LCHDDDDMHAEFKQKEREREREGESENAELMADDMELKTDVNIKIVFVLYETFVVVLSLYLLFVQHECERGREREKLLLGTLAGVFCILKSCSD